MRELLSNLMKRGFDLLFHWTVAGIILAVWGFTPEHVVAEILRNAPGWVTSQPNRLPFALIGLTLIAWDIFLSTLGTSGYKITHYPDGSSDVEGLLVFPLYQFTVKLPLPRFKQKPKITLFPGRGNDVLEPPETVPDVNSFSARVKSQPIERSKRTWKWIAHGTLVNPNLDKFSP